LIALSSEQESEATALLAGLLRDAARRNGDSVCSGALGGVCPGAFGGATPPAGRSEKPHGSR
jgi:hypothetical protein